MRKVSWRCRTSYSTDPPVRICNDSTDRQKFDMPKAIMFWQVAAMEQFLEGLLLANLSQLHRLIPAIPWLRQLSENRPDRSVPFAAVAAFGKLSFRNVGDHWPAQLFPQVRWIDGLGIHRAVAFISSHKQVLKGRLALAYGDKHHHFSFSFLLHSREREGFLGYQRADLLGVSENYWEVLLLPSGHCGTHILNISRMPAILPIGYIRQADHRRFR